VRTGLVALLAFFDDEPQLGRLLVAEAPLAGVAALERRQRLFGVLAALLDEGDARASDELTSSRALTAELVVGGVFSVIHARLLERDGSPLVELAPSLMSFIVTPYLGRSGAGAELSGTRPLAGESAGDGSSSAGEGSSRAAGLPIRTTYRTTCVLRAIETAPRSSNREVAQAAGLTDEGQTSKLLGRLESRGLIENVGLGAAHGEPNAWLLTSSGLRVVKEIGHGFAVGVAGHGSRRVRGAA